MRSNLLLIFIFLFAFQGRGFAGFLSGDASPYVSGGGSQAYRLTSSIIMLKTPFSSIDLSYKIGLNDKYNFYLKAGVGTIDYSTVTDYKLTIDPVINGLGLEYLYFENTDTKEKQYFFTEYETVAWSVNKKSNSSVNVAIGFAFSSFTGENLRTTYRLSAQNFYAGQESEENIASSVKYSLSTDVAFTFSGNYCANIEGGIYLGDPGGMISYFGLGIGFNT